MLSKNLSINKKILLRLITFVVFIPVLYLLINFDSSLNLDYDGYESNYLNSWKQFEVGFDFLEDFGRFLNLSFEEFWFFLIIIELVLISTLYSNPYVFILAIPNLVFISQGLLGTQIRFAIAILLCLVLFKLFFERKRFYFISLITTIFHNGTLVFHFISFFLKSCIDLKRGLLSRSNFSSLAFFITSIVVVGFFVTTIMSYMGYHYYAAPDSKHMVSRSLASIIYNLIFLFFLFYFIFLKNQCMDYKPFIYLGFFVLVLSLTFYNYSIISGRYNLVFLLIEPFFFYSFYKSVGRQNYAGLILFLLIFAISCAKLLSVDLIF